MQGRTEKYNEGGIVCFCGTTSRKFCKEWHLSM